MRHIILDTETTGLSFNSGHRIVEIGCVELHNYLPTGRAYQSYVNPKRPMDPGATQVSGITDDFLKDKPLFEDIAADFLEFIEDLPLVIHNAAFDMGFLNGELGLLGLPLLSKERALDTVKIARSKFPGSPANLDALCRRFSIDLTSRTKHGALLDAQLLAEVFLQLQGGRQFGFDLGGDDKTSGELMDFSSLLQHNPRPFYLTEEEITLHGAFVETLKDPLWRKIANS